MAITTSGFYLLSLEKFFQVDSANMTSLSSTSCKYMLDTDADTPDFDLDDFRNDTSEVAAGGGYTAGGNAIAFSAGDGFSIATGTLTYDIADPQWTSSTITAMGGIICSGNATNTADEIYVLQDFVTEVVTVSGTLDVAINPSGVFTVT